MISADMKVLMNHIYEYQKGVRQMVLYTFNKKYEQFAIARLEHQHIDYLIKPVGKENLNLFFGTSSAQKRISSSEPCSAMTFADNANAIANAKSALVKWRNKNANKINHIEYNQHIDNF